MFCAEDSEIRVFAETPGDLYTHHPSYPGFIRWSTWAVDRAVPHNDTI